MKPTNEQLNEAAARLCGWDTSMYPHWVKRPDDEQYTYSLVRPPDYCADSNVTLELIGAVKEHESQSSEDDGAFYLLICREAFGQGWMLKEYIEPEMGIALLETMLNPRIVVECALKACGEWKEEWE